MARDDAGLILRALAARGRDQRPSSDVFVLGGFHESRLNLHAQQRRALNLVWALERRDRLQERAVAVVGAGVGGTTFAVAAAARGAHVWLIDENEEPITTQRASAERFLDPNLFDWPNEGWSRTFADMPYLNWRGGVAADVRAQMLAGLVAQAPPVGAGPGSLQLSPQHVATFIEVREPLSGSPYLAVAGCRLEDLLGNEPGDLPAWELRPDAAVVATGFLPEHRVEGAFSGSYWRDARLSEPPGSRGHPTVVGDGDGALTEVLRLALRDRGAGSFKHEDLRWLAGDETGSFDALYARVLDIESAARNALGASTLAQLADARDPLLSQLDARIMAVVRRFGVRVVTKGAPLRTNSFLINRFIASRLHAHNVIQIEPHTHAVHPSELRALTDSVVVWRVGPPRRERTALAQPALDMAAASQLLGGQTQHQHVAGLIADMLDNTRRRLWTTRELPPSLGRTGTVAITAELDRRHHAPPRHGATVLELEPPAHADRVLTAARGLARAAVALNAAKIACWWFVMGPSRHVVVSLDLVAIAADLTAARTAVSIKQAGDPDVELVTTVPPAARRARVWVQADPVDPDQIAPDGWGDLFSVAKTPPNWSPDQVQLDKRADSSRKGQPRSAHIFRAATRPLGHSIREGRAIAEALERTFAATADPPGRTIAALEGLVRSEPTPLGTLLAALTAAARWPGESSTQLVIDLLARGLRSRDGDYVRPTLYLFGRATAHRDPGPDGIWKTELLPGGATAATVAPEDFERRFTLAAVTDLRDETASGTAKRSIALNRAALLGPFRELAGTVPPADPRSHAALEAWLHDGDPGPLTTLADATGPPLNLAFSGLVATGTTGELERSTRRPSR